MTQSFDASITKAALEEAAFYYLRRPSRLPPFNSPNRPTLGVLYKHAAASYEGSPQVSNFDFAGEKYLIVWAGRRMCVVHARSGTLIVGGPVDRDVGPQAPTIQREIATMTLNDSEAYKAGEEKKWKKRLTGGTSIFCLSSSH
jgi:hypothetical protein